MSVTLSSILRTFAIAVTVASMVLAVASNAGAASQLGAAAPDNTTNSPCVNCSSMQFSDLGAPSYRAPERSVVTEFGFREGTSFGLNNTFTLQIWRPAGGSNYSLIAESAPLTMVGAANFLRLGYVRMSMQPGDVIGTRVNTPGGDTSPNAPAASGNAIGVIVGNPTIGSTFSPVSFNLLRLNLYAVIEPDADGDGFGDETQDLCPGDAAAGNTACSGSLVGVELTDRANGSMGSGPAGSLFVTTAVDSGNATSPIDGVVVRWRFKASSGAGPHRLRVTKLVGAGSAQVVRTSDAVDNPGFEGRIVRSGETRLPISAGDAIGLQTPIGGAVMFRTWPGLEALQFTTPPADGATATADSIWGVNAPMMSADVEPDADGDGFGDISQDQCPSSATFSDVCPPTLTAVKSSNAKFRVNTKGAVISAAKRGTTLSFTLGGGAASVKVTVQRVERGRRSGKKCAKQTKRNKRRKSCSRFVRVHDFSRVGTVGANSVAYSGRYKAKGRNRVLKPGKYRFSLVATNASGTASATSKTVRVVRR